MAARPPAALVAVGLVLTAVLAGGCADDEPTERERSEVVLALGFLADEFGYTATQVDCVRQDLEEQVGADLAEWSGTLRRIDRGELEVTDLHGDDEETLVGAISRCAVEDS